MLKNVKTSEELVLLIGTHGAKRKNEQQATDFSMVWNVSSKSPGLSLMENRKKTSLEKGIFANEVPRCDMTLVVVEKG